MGASGWSEPWRWSAWSGRVNRRSRRLPSDSRTTGEPGTRSTRRSDRKVVVLAFLRAECPLAEAYAPKLAEVARDFEGRGVGFFGVDANQQDGPVAIGRFAEKHGLPLPILKDVGNSLADRLGAERTPEVFVLDGSRVVVYRGRVDNQYAIGIHRPSPTRHDLVDALEWSSPGDRSRRRGRTRSAAESAGPRSRPGAVM